MDLRFDQLGALNAALTEGTFEAAARRLRITPSAISQRIKALESATGRVLVQRTKPVRATESGRALLRLARQLDLLTADAARELGGDYTGAGTVTPHESHTPTPVRLPIAVNADSLDTWVLPALAAVPDRNCFDLYREDETRTTELLRDGTVMAAITATAAPVPGCRVTRLGVMRYRPMASPEFAATWFADRPATKAFAVAPVVQFDRSDVLQNRHLRRRTRHPADPPCHYVPSSAGFASAVRLGLGWGMLPDIQVAGDPGFVAIDGDAHIDVPLYWQQWRLDSPALNAAAEAIAAAAAAALPPPARRSPTE
ncbi:LysR family transcriptional regulator ArgP [Nocardia panacis]|uniref:LysR family transcriptional regulator ArgP n=1 Tax=Nocardia panacis TaxID=2340916 RepID=A0A3A4K9C7_9NOCA|nr:LysR family transcriptional regulator ArgP [Nocardia panacis]RJO69974.1 LysR family transcriptional regulator ArgP [Nocardia panacis]